MYVSYPYVKTETI